MKVSLAPDTLAYQLGVRPALVARDMSSVPLKTVVGQINQFMELDNLYDWIGHAKSGKETPMGNPQKDALIFYAMKHAAMLLKKRFNPVEPLPPEVLAFLDHYHEQVVLRGTRMFYYLMKICVRESRHSNGCPSSVEKNLRSKYTDAVVDFHRSKIEPVGESSAVAALLKSPPDVPLGLWLGFMSEHFREYHYGGAFGGEPWGRIADVARDFAKGELSLDLLLDTAFTLSHNTSPAFDKGMLFSHYESDLLKILDVQASGQVPQLVNEKGVKVAHEADVQMLFNLATKAVGAEQYLPKPYVDWYKVEEDFKALSEQDKKAKKKGHVANYPNEKKQQAMKYGIPATAPSKSFVADVKAKKEQMAKEAEALALVQIFPGQFLKKVAREDIA